MDNATRRGGISRGVIATFAMAALVSGAVGCSKPPKSTSPLFPTHGKVTLDGTPLADAAVDFIPTNETQGQGGNALTGADGSYTASTHLGEPGLPAGDYRVTISKRPAPKTVSDPNSGEEVVIANPNDESLPAAYVDRQNTVLTGNVPASGEATIDFPLTSKVKKGAFPSGPRAAEIPPGLAPRRR